MNCKITRCDTFDCIYNHDKNCILTEVSIGMLGGCSEFIQYSIPYELKERLKLETLHRLHGREFDYPLGE